MTSVPAKYFANVTPGVIAAGGTGLDLIGLFLTNSTRIQIGSVLSFSSLESVSNYFSTASVEYAAAAVYFNGFTNSNKKPGSLLFAQYPSTAVSAYLRGGNVGAALTLTQLKAIPSSKLTIITDGVASESASIVLSGATSFSNAAALIQAAFTLPGFSVSYDSISGSFVFTNTSTGATSTQTYAKSTTATASACTSLATVLTVGGSIAGTFNVGDVITGTDSTNTLPAGCYIVAQLTGATPGGAGTYTISAAAAPGNLSSCAVTARGYSGAMAASLMLSQVTGAVLSQGAAVAVPATFMNNIIAVTTNWASFCTLFDPDTSGNTNKEAFSTWNNSQIDEFVYVCWDTDVTATTTVPATTSLGYLLDQANVDGTFLVYDPSNTYIAAFVCGLLASIDYEQTNGNINPTYKTQSGLVATVTDQTVLANLEDNGYNCIVSSATANDQFTFLWNGQISGAWMWLQPYVNQIWLNASFQLSLMLLLTSAKSIPYNNTGEGMIHAALMDTINAALNFGAIQPGITLSATQIAQVNSDAGTTVDTVLSTRGWYLQILSATPTVRQNRGTPPCAFWYTDGGSVQKISLSSVDLL